MRLIKIPWRRAIRKTGSQFKKAILIPKRPIRALPIIWRLAGKPRAPMSSNLEKPPERRFIKVPKMRKEGAKPAQNLGFFVDIATPRAASSHSSPQRARLNFFFTPLI